GKTSQKAQGSHGQEKARWPETSRRQKDAHQVDGRCRTTRSTRWGSAGRRFSPACTLASTCEPHTDRACADLSTLQKTGTAGPDVVGRVSEGRAGYSGSANRAGISTTAATDKLNSPAVRSIYGTNS